jgi:hypothetical protein
MTQLDPSSSWLRPGTSIKIASRNTLWADCHGPNGRGIVDVGTACLVLTVRPLTISAPGDAERFLGTVNALVIARRSRPSLGWLSLMPHDVEVML